MHANKDPPLHVNVKVKSICFPLLLWDYSVVNEYSIQLTAAPGLQAKISILHLYVFHKNNIIEVEFWLPENRKDS